MWGVKLTSISLPFYCKHMFPKQKVKKNYKKGEMLGTGIGASITFNYDWCYDPIWDSGFVH